MEPVLVGLLVAFSWSGVAIGVAAMLAFLVRTPLKLALVDRRRRRSLRRTRLAWRVTIGELAVLVALGVGALVAAGWTWLIAPAAAVPLFAVQLWFDVRSRGRRLTPELCGAVGITAVAAAIVVAGGEHTRLAMAVSLILAARALGSIPFVRTQIVRLRRGHAPTAVSDAFQAAAVVTAVAAAVVHRPVVAGTSAVVLLAAAQLIWVRRPVPPVKVLGVRQMAVGLAIVAVTATGVIALS
jgi:hypothetical protein